MMNRRHSGQICPRGSSGYPHNIAFLVSSVLDEVHMKIKFEALV